MYVKPPHLALPLANRYQVRHVYMAALLGANEDMLAQFKEDAEGLVRLKRERSEEGGSPPKYTGNAETTLVSDAEAAVTTSHVDRGASHDVGQVQEEEISRPVRSHPFSSSVNCADQARQKRSLFISVVIQLITAVICLIGGVWIKMGGLNASISKFSSTRSLGLLESMWWTNTHRTG